MSLLPEMSSVGLRMSAAVPHGCIVGGPSLYFDSSLQIVDSVMHALVKETL